MWWRRFRFKFLPDYLYVCQCGWGFHHVKRGHFIGPYYPADDISRKYETVFATFPNVYSNNPKDVAKEWSMASARPRSLEDIRENYSDCGGWLERQAWNGRHSAP